MILPGNATLVLATVQQLLKLGGRIDRLMAQKTATQAQLVLGMPQVRVGNLAAQRALAKRVLAETRDLDPDPLAADRAEFAREVANPTARFDVLFQRHFPEEVARLTLSPDEAYLLKLRQEFPGVAWDDLSVRVAAFALAAGPSSQQIGYTGRIALAVADTILEFGAENTALFVRDSAIQAVAQSVLQRLAEPEWGEFDRWSPLLQTALRLSLNAALDHAGELAPDHPWLDAVLEALVKSRAAAPDPDEFLLGLVKGEGVPLLVSQGLLLASSRLESGSSKAFGLVAADVLAAAAPIVLDAANPSLGRFFRDHWGGLLRAGFSSVEEHGDRILAPGQPLLQGVLRAMVGRLAGTPDSGFLSGDMVFRLADAAVGVVAANPGELPGLENKPWLREFVAAAAASAQRLSTRNLLTRDAADALLADALGVLAKHPSLVVGGRPVTLALATSVFETLAAAPQLTRTSARLLGESSLRAAFGVLAEHPQLVSTKFAPVVTAAATQLAGWVGAGRVTAEQAAALASAVVEAVARNPRLYAGAADKVAGTVLAAVEQAIPADAAWASGLFVAMARQTLLACARSGASAGAPGSLPKLQTLLASILAAGLEVGERELGKVIDLEGIPPVVGELIARALRGELTEIDATSPVFVAAFTSIALRAA